MLARTAALAYPPCMPSIEAFYRQLVGAVRRRRLERGLTQSDIAARVVPAVTRASIANLELGHQRVLAHTLVQLSEILDLPVMDLLKASPAPARDWDAVAAALQSALKLPRTRAVRLARRLEASS
jgi:transcriptional regulator with XRE-family HTH domain